MINYKFLESIRLEKYHTTLIEADISYDTLLLMNEDNDFEYLKDVIDVDDDDIDIFKAGIRLEALK